MNMNRIILLFCIGLVVACGPNGKMSPTAQSIVDESIQVSGGERYKKSIISFDFRNRTYIMERQNGQKVLKRVFQMDSTTVLDIRKSTGLQRFVNDSLVFLPDSMANKYGNSINSVHYFAYLPYGLNDAAVNKKYLGRVPIGDLEYHKIEVTFDQVGGGDDYDDTYVYWFNVATLKPDYIAYEFHVDGGGVRFRKAFNERYVGGIRFVDYQNYKTLDKTIPVQKTDSLFSAGKLELLSQIELTHINVLPDSYN